MTYPVQGVYTLQALWRASCGTQLGWATTSFSVGSGVENCTNNADDDADGLIDCEDPECGLDPTCHESDCNDLVDNDRDGSIDCADSDCVSSPDCPEVICADGVDNNHRRDEEEDRVEPSEFASQLGRARWRGCGSVSFKESRQRYDRWLRCGSRIAVHVTLNSRLPLGLFWLFGNRLS